MKKARVFIIAASVIFLMWQIVLYKDNVELHDSLSDDMETRALLFYISLSALVLTGIVSFALWMYNVRVWKWVITMIGAIGSSVFWYKTNDYFPPMLFAIISIAGVIIFYAKRVWEKRQERLWKSEIGLPTLNTEDRYNGSNKNETYCNAPVLRCVFCFRKWFVLTYI